MNPTQLAGVVKRVYASLDITDFKDRLKLQKTIYLLQAFGINLGYNFRLYMHGPYSTQLARDGFDMPPIAECLELKFEDSMAENLFLRFLEFIKDKKDSALSMEILASLHLFHRIFPEKSEKELVKMILDKSIELSSQENLSLKLLSELKINNDLKW